jgi:hypothetical protein
MWQPRCEKCGVKIETVPRQSGLQRAANELTSFNHMDHLDRKLERMLVMLFKLQELRRTGNPT